MSSDKNHFDVIVIGSGFGGSVAAMRAAEKGYKVCVLESGKRWPDEDVPTTSWDVRKFAWQPEAEMFGIQRMEFLDDVLVLCGAGVGGGSHVYGNTLYVPPKKFFDAPEWSRITDWADEMAPYIDQATRMLGVVRVPYMDTMVDRLMRDVAADMGKANSFNKAPVGVYFGTPGVEAEDPYFGGAGPRRRGCISCGNCMIGCGHNAKNKLTVNYLYLAEKLGAEVRELLRGARDPAAARGRLRGAGPAPRLDAAHGPSAPPHVHGRPGDRFGARLRLGQAAAPHEARGHPPEPVRHAGEGRADELGAAAVDQPQVRRLEARSGEDPHHAGVGGDHLGRVARRADQHRAGRLRRQQRHHGVRAHLSPAGRAEAPRRGLAQGAGRAPVAGAGHLDARHWSERQTVLLCMQTSDTSIDLYWKDDMLRSRHGGGTPPSTHIPVVEDFANRLAQKMDGDQSALWFEVANRTASAHFIGGMSIAERADQGVVDPVPARLRVSRPARHRRQRHARQPGREPVADDHRRSPSGRCRSGPTRARPISARRSGRATSASRPSCRTARSCRTTRRARCA